MLGARGPLSAGFESGFACGFWFRAIVGLKIFFETLFDLVLTLRVFFFATVFTIYRVQGKLDPLDSLSEGSLRLLIRSDETSSQFSEG